LRLRLPQHQGLSAGESQEKWLIRVRRSVLCALTWIPRPDSCASDEPQPH
jgi:hypothetical protein